MRRLFHRYRAHLLGATLLLGPLGSIGDAWGHGGTPRVLSVHRSEEGLRVLDTLGVFEAPLSDAVSEPSAQIEQMSWRWLCDDAVDMMAGVDAALKLDEGVILAISRSGAYRSQDGGCSFSPLGEPLSLHAIPHLSAHPDQPAEVAVASHTLGRPNDVFVSQDGGLTWREAGLNVMGGIYALWRNPSAPDELWVSHAEGLSVSRDGGASFTSAPLEAQAGLTLSAEESAALLSRPQALKLMGGGVVTSGPLSGQQVKWMSVNLYPDSTLMRSVGEGPWEPVHQVPDSYDSLAFTGETVVVSTTFNGVFRRGVGDVAAPWSNEELRALGCLYAWRGELWACGRGDARPWLVGRSLDEGASWSPVWGDYSDAAGASWGCPAESPSLEACSARCLDETCDPSGLTGGAQSVEGGSSQAGASEPEDVEERGSPHAQSGCNRGAPHTTGGGALLLLLCVSLAGRAWRRSRG